MAEPTGRDVYLASLAARLTGSRRARNRLLTEIAGHLDDAISCGVEAGARADEAERRAIDLLGPPAAIAGPWNERCSRIRERQRRRVGLLVATATAASVLAVAQHADGRRDQVPPPAACNGQHAAVLRTCDDASR
jgi:hypothetical protein